MSFLDVPGVKAGALDASIQAKIEDTASATRGALNATYALKTDVPPNTLDGGNATSTYTGTFNFDGGSAA